MKRFTGIMVMMAVLISLIRSPGAILPTKNYFKIITLLQGYARRALIFSAGKYSDVARLEQDQPLDCRE